MPRDRVALPAPLIYIAKVALLATVYYGAARLGLRYASIGESMSLVWPPTGIAFAALTLLGHTSWPGIALGAFLANAATPVPLLAAAGMHWATRWRRSWGRLFSAASPVRVRSSTISDTFAFSSWLRRRSAHCAVPSSDR